MSRKNKAELADRVARAAEAALAAKSFVSATDILVGIGWLDPGAVERWRRGQIDCLEGAVQANLSRVSEAMRLFRIWATAKGLFASPTEYCRTHAAVPDAALQPKRKCRNRGVVSHTLGVAGAFREEA